jgi:hypothetical protein
MYPSVTLAELGDPLELARAVSSRLPAGRANVLEEAQRRVESALQTLPAGDRSGSSAPDQRWYWAAPFLLDRADDAEREQEFADFMHGWAGWDGSDRQSRLADHVGAALGLQAHELGPRPDDLAAVLARMAVGSPANCGLRALSRVSGGREALADPTVRDWAFAIATGFRSLFNRTEVMSVLRTEEGHDATYWMRVLEHCVEGCLQSVLDEYAHVLVESEGLQDSDTYERAETIAEKIDEALTLKTVNNTIDEIKHVNRRVEMDSHRVRVHMAARFGQGQADDKTIVRESQVRTAFNSPFWPFVLASTSVGQEGLDFHTYSHAVVHWNLPGNPVDLEQREGRVHRYKGHAVRKNIGRDFAHAAFHASVDDPWYAMFLAAAEQRPDGQNELFPSWVYAPDGGAKIERYVPTLPLSQEELRHQRLLRTVGAYRLVVGQPRQEDLLRYLGDRVADLEWLRIDLAPPQIQPSQ